MTNYGIIPDHVWDKIVRRTGIPAAARGEFDNALRHYQRWLSHNARALNSTAVTKELLQTLELLDEFRQTLVCLSDDALHALTPIGQSYEVPNGVIFDLVSSRLDEISKFISDGVERLDEIHKHPTRKQRDLEATRWYMKSVEFLLIKYECKYLTAPERKAPDWLLELCHLADPKIRDGTVDGALIFHLGHREEWLKECEVGENTRASSAQRRRRGKSLGEM